MPVAIRLLLLAGAISALQAELIDRIAVSVGNRVITESEIRRHIRVQALLNREPPDFSTDARRRAADALVEQALIRREMESGPFGSVPEGELEAEVRETLRQRYPSEAAYRQALQTYNLADDQVRQYVRWMIRLVHFVDVRFRPGVQISEAELRDAYESTYRPEWEKRNNGKAPAFEDAREAVETSLTGERANQALDRWLGQTRTQTRIRYREEVFR